MNPEPAPEPVRLTVWLDRQLARPDWPLVRHMLRALAADLEPWHARGAGFGGLSPDSLHVAEGPRLILSAVAAQASPTGSPQDDMLALGQIVYRLVVGRSFEGSSMEGLSPGATLPLQQRAQHLAAGDYPSRFLALVDRMLDPEPGKRPSLAEFLAEGLAIETEPTRLTLERPADRGTVAGASAPAPWRGFRRVAIGVGLGLCIAAFGAGLVIQLAPMLRNQADARTPAPAALPPPVAVTAVAAPSAPPAPAAVAPPIPAAPAPAGPPSPQSTAPAPPPVAAEPVPAAQPVAIALVETPATAAAIPTLPVSGPWRDCPDCPEMLNVPAGAVRLSLQLPGRTDRIGADFLIERPFAAGRYEVTRAEFAYFLRESGYAILTGCHVRRPVWHEIAALDWSDPGYPQEERHPVACVSFLDAQAYLRWLSARTGQTYRLPSDVEWQFIAQAGLTDPAPNAAEQCRFANGADASIAELEPGWQVAPCRDGFRHTAPVGSLAPTGIGFGDLFGNLWEWVDSCLPREENGRLRFAPCDAAAPRLLRGGSWSDRPDMLVLDARLLAAPDIRDQLAGFRVVRELEACEVNGSPCAPVEASPPPVTARAAPAGSVEEVRGEAQALSGANARLLAMRSNVFVGETLRTGRDARARVKLGSRTTLRLGELASVRLARYLVDAGGEIELNAGAIEFDRRGAPSETPLTFRSPYGLIAVRGTRFLAGISAGRFGVFVEQGSVAVTSGGVTRLVETGRGVDILRAGDPPTEPQIWGEARLNAARAAVR